MSISNIIARTSIEPRPYQSRIVTKVSDMFEGRYTNALGHQDPPSRSVMIESPTGSGKTVMGMMSSLVLQHNNPDLVVAWVAMRRNLLAQAQRENEGKGINVRNIHYVSMFDKSPLELVKANQEGRPILLVVDECLVGETLVHTLVDGKESLVPISDIVDNGIGSHVLSYCQESDCLEWMPILSRVCTGDKEVFDVEIETEDGRSVVITATANHKFLAGDGEYYRLDELNVGSEVFVKHDSH